VLEQQEKKERKKSPSFLIFSSLTSEVDCLKKLGRLQL
jgi:hypothetical protein